jgi:hypothetical protein
MYELRSMGGGRGGGGEELIVGNEKFNSSSLVTLDFNKRQRWKRNKKGEMKQKRKQANKGEKKKILFW